jgi:antirestriction protein
MIHWKETKMTAPLYAQPYDLAATGFYFESHEDYSSKAAKLRNDYGDPVEEFEIQFIDGEAIDCALAAAIGINQANLKQYFDAVEEWGDHDKTCVILAVGEGGYRFEDNTQPSDFDVEIHHVERMRDLAEQLVDEGVFGDIPERLQFYIDYDAIARDLSADYSEVEIAGTHLIYRCN